MLIITGLFILLLFVCWGSNFLSLPGNWINILLLALWRWGHPDMDAGLLFFALLLLVAGLGELLEFVSQSFSARRYGGTSQGGWGALGGAFIGAILGVPFFLGFGSILGSIAGAFLGSLLVELASKKGLAQALRASKGAMWGRVFGIVAKAGLGMLILGLSIPRL